MRRARALVCALFVSAATFASSAAEADTWPSLASAPHVEGDASKDAALIIGIEQYAFVPHVEGAASNARDWFTFLVQGQKMPISRAHLLQNNDGTREQILSMAKKVASEVEPGGRLWIVFIGHGAPSADGKDGMLVGVDAQQTANGLYARSVSQREVLEAASGSQASTMMIVDACFSGRTGSGAPLAPGLQPLVRVKESGPMKAGKSDTVILSAGTSEQFAGPLPGANRPAFSYLVLGALRGWGDKGGKGEISAQDAVDYAKLVMTVVPLGRTQTPELSAANAKVVLARGAREKAPELSRIVTTQPAGPESKEPKTPPTPITTGASRIRLRAVCGDSPAILARSQGLVVEEIMDASDRVLRPASSIDAELRYDDASQTRKPMPPEYVDFELPSGAHRIRVKAKGCKSVEERLALDAGKTFEFAPHLETIVIPRVSVNFGRPAFADAADVLRVRGSDGKIVCDNLPCSTKVPSAEQRFSLGWMKGGGGSEIETRLPDPPASAGKDTTVQGNVVHDRSSGPGPLLIAGGLLGSIVSGIAFFAVKSAHACTYEGTTNTSTTVTTQKVDGMCGTAPTGFRSTKSTEEITGTGTALLAVAGIGLGVAAIGGVMTFMKIGGTDSISVNYAKRDDRNPNVGKLRVMLGPTGAFGTF